MKALIIGGAGFVGGYLINELSSAGAEVHATCLENETITQSCSVHVLDILDQKAVEDIINEIAPDVIFHLAAQSSVALSWKRPQLTANINVIGSINVLEALKNAEKKDIRILLIGSGEEYGFIREGACPINEEEILRPGNIYAACPSTRTSSASRPSPSARPASRKAGSSAFRGSFTAPWIPR